MNLSEQQNVPLGADNTLSEPGGAKAAKGKVSIGGRRSQRVRFEMPVSISFCRENGETTSEEGKTLSVNAQGALLVFATPVNNGDVLRLVNPRTKNEIKCRVCRFGLRYPTR